MAAEFHELTIASVEQLTDDAVAIEFAVSRELADTFQFKPGQYLTLRAQIDGEDIRRSYSICSPVGTPPKVGIKQVDGGRFSTFAQGLKPGDTLQVMPPDGRFVCAPDKAKKREFILIAAGSGITPVLSIAASILENEPQSLVTLLYGNRQTASIMFREAIEDLKDEHLERFHVYHVLSREAQDVEMFHGRIDVDRVTTFAEKKIIDPAGADGIYLCGPMAMTLSIAEHFEVQGGDPKRIFTELFDTSGDTTPVEISSETRKAAEDGVGIRIILDGLHRDFALTNAEHTVLQAAEQSGLDLPFSCAGGMCATCRCKLVEGDAEMDKNYSLDDWEIEAGFVLACQLRPKSEKLVLDFDAA